MFQPPVTPTPLGFNKHMGGGLSPAHHSRNPFASGVAYPQQQTRRPTKPRKQPDQMDRYFSGMERLIKAGQPKANAGIQNAIIGMLGGETGHVKNKKGKIVSQGSGGPVLDNIPGHIGGHQSSGPIQEFLPEWLTEQTQKDIIAKGHVRNNPHAMLANLSGNRGLDASSPMYTAKVAQQRTRGLADASRAAQEVGLRDHMERQKFAIRHAMARHGDVIQGSQNQAQRDAIMQGGQGQQLNFIMELLNQFYG